MSKKDGTMGNKRKILFIVFILIVLLFFVYIYNEMKDVDQALKPIINNYSIYFPSLKENLHIRTSIGGLLGNNYNVIISTEDAQLESWVYKDSRDLKYKCEDIYYKINEDTLILYTESIIDIPPYFNTKIKLVQKKLTSNKESRLVRLNYIKEGLTKISVYDGVR